MNIDISRLRKDIYDYYTSAFFCGFGVAIIGLSDIYKYSDEEIVNFAITLGFNIDNYIIDSYEL